MWTSLYTPTGILKYEKLNYRITRFSTLLDELIGQVFSGYIEILAPHEHGLIILYNGKVHNCFYEGTEDLNLDKSQIIEHFLSTETKERETIINVGELNPRIIVALGALEPRPPAHRELETVFLDLNRLFETLARKHFTGTLRFYRIRNNTRLGNILLRMKKITADQLREAIRLQLSGEGALRLGDALVQSGAIGKQDLEDALDRQTYTRKGSDLEMAIALFSEGEFLGGFRHADKVMITDRKEVISWMGVAEILMDIIDGMLPAALDVESILHPKTEATVTAKPDKSKEKAAPSLTAQANSVAAPNSATATPSTLGEKNEKEIKERTALDDNMIRELTQETFMLKADDLILDIHPHPSPAPLAADGKDYEPADKNMSWLDDLVRDRDETEKPLSAEAQSLGKIAETILEEEHPPRTSQLKVTEPVKPNPQAVPAPSDKSASTQNGIVEPVVSRATVAGTESRENGAAYADEEKVPDPNKSNETVSSPESVSSEFKAAQIRSLELIEKVLKERMGFLGMALLEREKRHFEIPAVRNISVSQLRSINQRLFHSTSMIVGEKMAVSIMDEIEEKIGG